MYREMANWTGIQRFGSELTKLGISGDRVSPFSMLLAEDNPANQLVRSLNLAANSQDVDQKANSAKTSLEEFVSPVRSGGKVKLGYFSSDFRDHPVLHLLMGMLREHDRSSFELYGYSSGRVGECAMREEAKGYFDVFTDINEMSDADVVKLARKHQLDVAINLSGYTYQPRNGVFAHRVAPVQINYLGFPSTMGADFMDYIVADKVIIPEEYQQYYSEKVLYLPDVYLPNDDKREVANTNTKRSDFGLPEDGFVFCCFNSSYKISPAEFDVWMRILRQVEDSVLWLSNSNKWAVENLKKEAEKRGISADRIIFASRLEKNSEHLARHKHADLFIDTFNYNAHTTAGDALMTGLPLVTKQGEQFAARVASSLLHALDLDELVTRSVEEYEALILELATKPKKLKAIKAKLAKSLASKPAFDTKTYTQNFEQIIKNAGCIVSDN
jgi:predicted O-linked N-acetylglucosamine transferase (SPINDLY family)